MKDRFSLIYKGMMPDLLCCDTILREMPDKSWVVAMLGGGHMEPLPENGVFLFRSRDKGMSWSRPRRLFSYENKTLIPTELAVIKEKCVLFLISHDGKFHDWRCLTSASEDCGETWSDPVPFEPCPYFTAIRTLHATRSGEILLPYQQYGFDPEEYLQNRDTDRYFCDNNIKITPFNGVVASSDGGASWTRRPGIPVDTGQWTWAENNVAELKEGRLAMLTRVDGAGVLYRADSCDGGRSWDSLQMYPTGIPNPGSKFRLFSLKDGRIALIHNPSPAGANCMAGRRPLSIWISGDDMETWEIKRDLVTFPGQLSYPDGFADEEDGYIHFAFDY
ncbi:MAG: exo-alpha-sialidase, partial [Deltaproteobacteria bacterium]|nr:exo-alpha-sialidase [Deltaproteobacteria bacterium]